MALFKINGSSVKKIIVVIMAQPNLRDDDLLQQAVKIIKEYID